MASPAGAQVTVAAPQQLTGGLSQVSLGNLAVARDGTGGLVYTAAGTDGVSHVFLARLLNGVFEAPVQLDPGALGGASQPVITADNGGQLLVAFVSGDNLYGADTLSSAQALSSPSELAAGASNPAISMNLYGVGYLAYSATSATGDDVDVLYFNGTSWSPASPEAMNDTSGDVAGTGSGAPSMVAASDGTGIVAWGEGGHVYSRRLMGTETSVEIEQDDVASYDGLLELSATDPQISSGGDSTYPDIVFTETFQDGPGIQTRAMLTRLVAEDIRPATAIDGVTAAGQNGIQPQVAMSEFGRGLITAVTGNVTSSPAPTATTTTSSATTTPTSSTTTATGSTTTTSPTTTSQTATNATTTTQTSPPGTGTQSTATPTVATTPTPGTAAPYGIAATVLANNGAAGAPAAVGPSADASDPDAVPAVFGSTTSALIWDQDGGAGLSQVLLSYAADGLNLAAPVALSSVVDGTIQPGDGLALSGDSRGDGVAAWVQGSPPGLSIFTSQLYTPESRPLLDPGKVYANVSQPTLNWEPSAEDWGPVNYAVSLDNAQIGQSTGTSLQLSGGLTDGTYSWGLNASNAVGDVVPSAAGTLVVDTFAPRLRLRLTGSPRRRSTQSLTLAYTDPPNPSEPGSAASGVKSVTVNWGDGTKATTSTKLISQTHAYARAGVYELTATVTDKASNTTTLTRLVRVLP
jgi:hypothetical protein